MIKNIPYGSIIYLCGKMRGEPCLGYAKFFYWQVVLEKSGYKVINPSAMDVERMLTTGYVIDQDDIHAIGLVVLDDLQKVFESDAVFVIGDNWEESTFAPVEIAFARGVGKLVVFESEHKGV